MNLTNGNLRGIVCEDSREWSHSISTAFDDQSSNGRYLPIVLEDACDYGTLASKLFNQKYDFAIIGDNDELSEEPFNVIRDLRIIGIEVPLFLITGYGNPEEIPDVGQTGSMHKRAYSQDGLASMVRESVKSNAKKPLYSK